MDGKKFYITTAIDYANAPPHIGHALEKVQADVLARYERRRGNKVFFLTGTDEHGMKIARAAEKAHATPQEFTDDISAKFRSLKETLNLSWDDFVRTTDKARHWPGVVLMWNKLKEKGDIYKKTYKGLYCVGHEAFITQKDLVNGKCADHLTEPEVIEEENYFFRLSKYSDSIAKRVKSGEFEIVPGSREHEILSFLERGVEDISFSRSRRSLTWGIPVPDDETQTIYVWVDALINYISAIGYGRGEETFKHWWPADLQVIGKDILRFHAVIWPAMLLSAGLPLPKAIFAHGFITIEGEKMSKSVGNVIDPGHLVGKYGTDAVRYYLLKEIPSYGDGDFSIKRFEGVYNSDLANGLGNFASRVLTLGAAEDKFSSKLPIENEVSAHIQNTRTVVSKKIDEFRLNEALSSILDLVGFGDAYINRMAPWDIEDFVKRSEIIFNLIVILDNVAAFIGPFLPETSEKITACVEWQDHTLRIKKGGALFPRLR